MRDIGELALLAAFVASGFAAFASVLAAWRGHRRLATAGTWATVATVVGLTLVMAILGRALVAKDYRLAYVAQYADNLLPWHYALSALWVGQAGSLLLWAWFSAVLVAAFHFRRGRLPEATQRMATGVMMGAVTFLIAVMVFAADPMQASVAAARDGAGMSPLLLHPAMLVHPPIVFLGYALWMVPCALAIVALATGRLDAAWVRAARPWALSAWVVLGVGILVGADWAYEELGWGGYWGWDPVENGSLIPWLTGTALLHTLMAWQYQGVCKKTALALALATFGLCNFATFLTRSGIFSSLHAFSSSPIGWLFLILMAALAVAGGAWLWSRRAALRAEAPLCSLLTREALILLAVVALLLLTAVTIAGTLSTALSNLLLGHPVMPGPEFYNYVLIPTGLLLLVTTGLAPLLRWGGPPTAEQRRWIGGALVVAGAAVIAALAYGVRHPLALAIAGGAALAPAALVGSIVIERRRRAARGEPADVWQTVSGARRQYSGFLMHLGFVSLVVGVTGSSLGTRQEERTLCVGEAVTWAGYDLRLARLHQHARPDKLVAEAELQVMAGTRLAATLRPARHFHLRPKEWTTEVAIHSTWRGDLYVILNSGDGTNSVRVTLIENPMMRWLWLSGWLCTAGALARLWPSRRRALAGQVPAVEEQPPLRAAA